MKKIIQFTLAFILIFTSCITSDAAFSYPEFTVDGRRIFFDGSMGYPYLTETGRTMMPVRLCLSSIGCSVDWDQETQTVISKKGNTKVDIPVEELYIIVNEKPVAMDTAAVLKDGRTYLPLRAVLEAYGYQVEWEQETKTVLASMLTPYNINGGTTGIFSRKQLPFTGFDGIQADVTLPTVNLGQKGDCPYIYFGFDWMDDKGNVEGGFQFIEDPTHPGYNRWTAFMRQGNDWRWGNNIILEQGSTHNLKFYSFKVSDNQTDLVIELDGREIIRKVSTANNFNEASAKTVIAMAMSIPFDGTNCPSSSIGAKISNLKVSEYTSEQYCDFSDFNLFRQYRNGNWYGTTDCIPAYLHTEEDDSISIYN